MLQEKGEEAHFLVEVKTIPLRLIYKLCLLTEYSVKCLQRRNHKKNMGKLCGERKPY